MVPAYALRRTAPASNLLAFSIGQQAFVSLINSVIGLGSLAFMLHTLRPSNIRRHTHSDGSRVSTGDP